MLTRIVKMEFHPENVSEFICNFDAVKDKIKNFEGCTHVELLQDKNDSCIFFTYSKWKDEQALNKYRNSELFQSVWARTKKLFRCKAQAWSTQEHTSKTNRYQ